MRPYILIYLFSLLLLLVGCALKSPTVSYNTVQQCQLSCKAHFETCRKTCRNNCEVCQTIAIKSAAKDFFEYQREQRIKGERFARDLNSYRDPLQCRKITCCCPADYAICTQSCVGVLHKELRVAHTC